MFIISVKANKHQSKQAVKIAMTWVKSPIGPDGEKAFIQVASSYDALDVTYKIGIFYTESGWLILNIFFFTVKQKIVGRIKRDDKCKWPNLMFTM